MTIIESERGLILEFSLNNPHSLHARPAARLAQMARRYDSEIFLIGENGEVDAKSMLDILSLAPKSHEKLRLLALGDDAREALSALNDVISSWV